MNEASYRNLRALFGAYLHQDWGNEFAQPVDAIDTLLRDEPRETVAAAYRELTELLPEVSRMEDAAASRFLCDVLWCQYYPKGDGLTVVAWLDEVRQILAMSCQEPKNAPE